LRSLKVCLAAVSVFAASLLAVPHAYAVSLNSVTSVGPGSQSQSLLIAWDTDYLDSGANYLGIAKAFNPVNPCDFADWDTTAQLPGNPAAVGYVYLSGRSSPLEFTSYLDWSSGSAIAIEGDESYVACLFVDDSAGISGDPNLAIGAPVEGAASGVAGTGPDLTIWHLSVGRGPGATCPSGYFPSWAAWPHGGTGGFVCNRDVYAYRPLSS
jgi:hypothetical protein